MPSISASFQTRWATAVAGLAAWTIAVPWLAEAIGLTLDVATRLEIADHVVPGVLVLVGVALLVTRGSPPGNKVSLYVGGVVFLSGLWITATHTPLIFDAVEGMARWDAALLHLSAGPPITALGGWMLLRSQLFGSAPGAQRDG
jgi:predicted membrane channel-forming protein YqfA (hemolysin III family)